MKHLSKIFDKAVSEVTNEQISSASKSIAFVGKQYGDRLFGNEGVEPTQLNMIAHDASGDEFSELL